MNFCSLSPDVNSISSFHVSVTELAELLDHFSRIKLMFVPICAPPCSLCGFQIYLPALGRMPDYCVGWIFTCALLRLVCQLSLGVVIKITNPHNSWVTVCGDDAMDRQAKPLTCLRADRCSPPAWIFSQSLTGEAGGSPEDFLSVCRTWVFWISGFYQQELKDWYYLLYLQIKT